MFWRPQPDANEYVALAIAVGRAFRLAAPDEKLIGPATGLDWPFLEVCFKAGLLDYWTAVSVHPYRQTDPEEAANDYCRLRKMIEHYRTRSGSDGDISRPARSLPLPVLNYVADQGRQENTKGDSLVEERELTPTSDRTGQKLLAYLGLAEIHDSHF